MLLAASFAIGLYAHHAAGRYFANDTLLVTEAYNNNAALAMQSSRIITKGNRQAYSYVIFCNPAYFDIHFMHFIEGGAWHISENNLQLVILNEALAWYLFGGANITGMVVEIDDTFFKIIGVVRQGSEYMAWLPNGGKSRAATSVYLHRDYRVYGQDNIILDVDRYIESIGRRFRVLLYVVLLYLAIIFLKRKTTPSILAGAAICLVIIIGVNNFLLWLPNLSAGFAKLLADLTNIGILPNGDYLSYGLRQMVLLNGIANFVWLLGFVGLSNLIFIGAMVKDG